ncbi:MAG: DivIVA domain-containing protein [Oscillospiraceae bacterium]|nr:DivIVA domain-containing protein [Oscillospiraceae bacterium]
MITAKDIQKKRFEKVKFGYSPEEVDSFLSQIENDLRLMQQELDSNDAKIKLLAGKVQEYRNSEEDITKAMLLAQKQAREVVQQAEAEAEAIVTEARNSVESVKSEAMLSSEEQLARIRAQLDVENAKLVTAQKQVTEFKQSLFDMYKEHLEMISLLPDVPDEEETADEDAEEAPAEEVQETPAEEPKAEETAAPQNEFESRRDETRRDGFRQRS